jgi:hypothetical protein
LRVVGHGCEESNGVKDEGWIAHGVGQGLKIEK